MSIYVVTSYEMYIHNYWELINRAHYIIEITTHINNTMYYYHLGLHRANSPGYLTTLRLVIISLKRIHVMDGTIVMRVLSL